jgi:hypothetical protein
MYSPENCREGSHVVASRDDVAQQVAAAHNSAERLRRMDIRLPRVQLDDQLLVDDRLHFFARRNVGDFALEPIAIDGQPVRNRNDLGQLEIAHSKLARFRFVFDRDLVARFHIVRSDVYAATVDLNMSMRHELARGIARIGKAESINHVVEAGFKKLKQSFTGHAAFAQSVLENPAKLALEQTVLIAKLLFFAERDSVFGLLPARAFWPVHSRRIIFPLERFRWSKNLDAVTAADSCFRSCVSSHG